MESFLWNPKRSNYKPNIKKVPSPKQNLSHKVCGKTWDLFSGKPIEGAPVFSLRGSMSVEAAIVLPLFLFLCINLSSAVEMIRLHGNLQLGLWEVGSILCEAGILEEELDPEFSEGIPGEVADAVISYGYVKGELERYLGEAYLETSPMEGAGSLFFPESEILGENDLIDLRASYRVSPPFAFDGMIGFRMANRFYGHLWNGYDVTGEKDPHSQEAYVYVTTDSQVYHLTTTCTHLKLTIRAVFADTIGQERNNNGSKYGPCELCAKGKAPDVFYVGAEGDCYHYSRDCYTLNRTYWAIPLSEAESSYRPCSRCGGGT